MDPMSSRDTSLAPDRLARLRGHLMTEIATQTAPAEVGPAPTHLRRWTLRRIGIAASAVAAATAAVFAGLAATSGPGGLGPSAFAVTHLPGDTVGIKVVNTQATADQMTRQLQADGVDVRIRTVPTTPQLVGTWVMASFSGEVPAAVSNAVAAQTRGYVATIELPAVFPGSITLYVGRAMRSGETPQVGGARNALAPGGLLFCDRLIGARPADAQRTLAADGYTVHWADGRRGLYTQEVATPPAGSRVTAAFIFDFDRRNVDQPIVNPHDVTVTVLDPRDPRFKAQIWLGFAPSQQTSPSAIDFSSCPTG